EQKTTEIITRQKRGRPVGSKDKNPRNRRKTDDANTLPVEEDKDKVETPEVVQNHDIVEASKDVMVPEDCQNDEISINYVFKGERWILME
ncbi:hypothetical protein PIB30_107669, partial [Stylosanthes scabra]|nr:hypothetical protein [Stylosanthes scabra]